MEEKEFELIPAIDILGGKCVRLTQGMYNKVEEYSQSPLEIAKKWVSLGAKRLHVIDLDGAKEGYPVNFKIIADVVSQTNVTIQVGGGIRTKGTIADYIACGVSYLIIGTKAFKDTVFRDEITEKHCDKVIISLDLKNNKIALSGWQEVQELNISKLSLNFRGIKQIIYTDITKDGTLSGPNLKTLKEIATRFNSKVFVSGGISKLEDILEILSIKKSTHPNISGVILGKSLYKGLIDLPSAIKAINNELKYLR